MKKNPVLVTGTAGFIGFHLARRLLAEGYTVTGVDNVNDYYDPDLKYARLRELGVTEEAIAGLRQGALTQTQNDQLAFFKTDLENRQQLGEIFEQAHPRLVVHLAAQAGVRYSVDNPYAYLNSNIVGFMNILENCRRHKVEHLVFASSSSVYGGNEKLPYSVHHNVDHPLSFYAATKKANELMAHAYSHLYSLPVTGLRFFTVYGPWGRPDMALFIFTRKILAGESIDIFNYGDMRRDFTFIDDIVEGVLRVLGKPPQGNPDWDGKNPDPADSRSPYRLFNIGNNRPVDLLYFIQLIERALGRSAKKRLLPLQPGDVRETYADVEELKVWSGFAPVTTIEEGVKRFIGWYRDYYKV